MRTLFLLILLAASVAAQSTAGSMALGPARFELELAPGTETTVVVNLDYRSGTDTSKPARIVASLSDWTLTPDGRVEFSPAGSRANSASPWMLYTPGEASVAPGTIHQIRVTVAVPPDAAPGDHLSALLVEQRPEPSRDRESNTRQMVVRYRMAAVFYIKVPGLTRKGSIEDLIAESTSEGIVVKPTLRNAGNSVIRPTASLKVLDEKGAVVAEIAESETLPVLASSTAAQHLSVGSPLPPGTYSIRYRVDFRDGGKIVDGVTDLVVKSPVEIATLKPGVRKN